MGEQTMETQKKVSLTKKDLNKAYWTFETYAQACCSYERLQAPGFFSGMRNIIDKLYDDDPEQKAEACQRHMEFYNSEFALVGPVFLVHQSPWKRKRQTEQTSTDRQSVLSRQV